MVVLMLLVLLLEKVELLVVVLCLIGLQLICWV